MQPVILFFCLLHRFTYGWAAVELLLLCHTAMTLLLHVIVVTSLVRLLFRSCYGKLPLSAESIIGSAGLVPCFVCCPEQHEGHQHKPFICICLGHPRQSSTDLVRIWQVCLALYTVLHHFFCLTFWLYTGQPCMWNIIASLLANVLMLRKKHWQCAITKSHVLLQSCIAACRL